MLHGVAANGLVNTRNIFASVSLLKVLDSFLPELTAQNLPNLSKLFLRLCKEYPQPSVTSNALSPTIVSILCESIGILNENIVKLAESRKSFISGIWQLLEKSNDARIHQAILALMKEWIVGAHKSSPLTWKEKSALALKFAALESRCGIELFDEFLRFILQIYSEESLAKTELYVASFVTYAHLL